MKCYNEAHAEEREAERQREAEERAAERQREAEEREAERQREAEEREEERRRHEEFEEEQRRAAEEYALAEKRAREQLKADIERNKKQLVVLSPDDLQDRDSKLSYKVWQDLHPGFKVYGNNGDWNGVEIEKLTYKLHGEVVEASMVLLNNAKGPTGTIRITVEHEYADGSSEICGAYCAHYNLDAKTQVTDNDIIIEYKPKKKKADDTRLRFCIYELSGKGKWVRRAKKAYKSNVEKQQDEKKKAEQEKRDAEARKRRQAEEAARQAAFRAEQEKKQRQSKISNLCAKLVQIAALLIFTALGVTGAATFPGFACALAAGAFGLFWLAKRGGYCTVDLAIGCGPAAVFAYLGDSNSVKGYVAVLVAAYIITYIVRNLSSRNVLFVFVSRILTVASLLIAVIVIPSAWAFNSGRSGRFLSSKVSDKGSAVKSYAGLPSFSKSYTSEMDIIIGQTYSYGYKVDKNTGALNPIKQVVFSKDGIFTPQFLDYKIPYKVDFENCTILTKKTKNSREETYRFFKDGSAFYGSFENRRALLASNYAVKDGAKFNAEFATEVIGKTFSGKWSDKYTASVTFGKNGVATVKFSDGDKGSGAYLASDADNLVLYNHNNKGVWFAFTYSDTSDDVTFIRVNAVKYDSGYNPHGINATYKDWKKK
ncbi:MAG: hypothetical protein K6G80_07020 [Treponema sp.]|nr:hypothetical protein [Treponema sp.]